MLSPALINMKAGDNPYGHIRVQKRTCTPPMNVALGMG